MGIYYAEARAHPKLSGSGADFKDLEMLETVPIIFKEEMIFFHDPIDQHRPEAKRFRKTVATFQSSKKKLILCPEDEIHPFYSTGTYKDIVKRLPDSQVCRHSPFLGIIPAEISDVFPASHNLATRSDYRPEDYPTFIESLKAFACRFEDIAIVTPNDFMIQATKGCKAKCPSCRQYFCALIYADAIRLQKDIAKKVVVAEDDFEEISRICGVDIAYSASATLSYCSAVIMDRNMQQLL